MVQLHAEHVDTSLQIGDFYLPYICLYGFALSIVLLGALYLLLYRTKFGYSLRATMQNRTAAQLIGIDVERVSAITFGIAVALAAAGGMAYGATSTFNPNSLFDLISRLLVIIILAGIGSLRGALFASLGMLVIVDVTAGLLGTALGQTVFFFFFFLLLFFFSPN